MMKRFHAHISVNDLNESIRFYSHLFGQAPSVQKADYAKWMLEDPHVNFAISARGHRAGVNHLGFQVDDDAELSESRARLASASIGVLDQPQASCCYAKSDKYWTTDPQGIAWETFRTLGEVPIYGDDTRSASEGDACCIPLHHSAEVAEATAGACCITADNGERKSACCG
jgi:catechol 2,3-dioxygenase-like lactoylglutathione lyase family enzyme